MSTDSTPLEEAWRIGGRGLACNQVLYHLQERGIEHAVLPWCEQHGVAVVGYSPFSQGRFPAAQSTGGRLLQAIAVSRGATPRQVALRFLVRRPSLLTIPKASNVDHAVENAGAGAFELTDDDVAAIDQAFPRGRRPANFRRSDRDRFHGPIEPGRELITSKRWWTSCAVSRLASAMPP